MNLKNICQDPLDGLYSFKGLCAHRTHIHDRERFEPKISVLERSKTVRASDYVTAIPHLTSKYFPRYPVLKKPQSVFFPLADWLIQKSRPVDIWNVPLFQRNFWSAAAYARGCGNQRVWTAIFCVVSSDQLSKLLAGSRATNSKLEKFTEHARLSQPFSNYMKPLCYQLNVPP
jgi:hypothetical protein